MFQFDIWKLVKRSDTSNPYSLTLRYRSDGTKRTDVDSKRLKATTVCRRRRRRPDSGTESDSSDSALTSTTDIAQRENESYFKDDYDFDGIIPVYLSLGYCENTGLRGFRPGPTQTGLYSHRKGLEA